VTLRRNRRRLAAVLTGASAAIHLTASVAHWPEWWVFAVVFALTALLQLCWRSGGPDLQATIDELLACIVLLTAVASPIRRALLRLTYGFEALALGMLVTSFVLLASGAGHPS